MKLTAYITALFLLTHLPTGCKKGLPCVIENGYSYVQKEGRAQLDSKEWRLVWQDEFNTGHLDTTRWAKIPAPTGKAADWIKHMSEDEACFDFSDGKIHLKGIVNKDTTKDKRTVLTGGIYTKGKFLFKYGRVEIHAKLESAQGAWPAMWMLPEKSPHGGWPDGGEIDIMEHLNFQDEIFQTVHSKYTYILKRKDPPHSNAVKVDVSQYNTYAVEWYPDSLVYFVNGERTFCYPKVARDATMKQWPFDEPFYILIDQQLGGSWVGEIKPEDLPVAMTIDWVRVYQ